MPSSESDLWPRRLAILGVGLLGGSVAKSIRRKRPDVHVSGCVRDAAKGEQWVECGILDSFALSVEATCQQADCVVVATPVDRLAEIALSAAHATPQECLITDVGSTKSDIVECVTSDPIAASKFVAAHPIAGSEKSGAQFSTATLFDQKTVVITPHQGCSADRLGQAKEFWSLIGGISVEMTAQQHDVHLASVSHVPHLVSALVAKMALGPARELVGSGWMDITRVAAGDPEMWTAICAANREAIIGELGRFADSLEELRQTIRSADDVALEAWLAKAKEIKEPTR